ncbi:TPA: acid stress response protein YqgB [Escherichia coli]|nr:acid stress response protein YqgB [Escherichia coli]
MPFIAQDRVHLSRGASPCAYGLLSQFQAAIVVNCFTLNKII